MRALAAAMLMAATPAAAHAAPVIAVDKPCYRSNTDVDGLIHVTGSGFTPGAEVAGTLADSSFSLANADERGNIDSRIATPSVDELTTAVVRIHEVDRPAVAAETPVRVVRWGMNEPGRGDLVRPRLRLKFRFTGWPSGSTIYAHYMHRGGKRPLATRRVARVRDACEVITRRRGHIPPDVLRPGRWDVRYSTSPTDPRRAPAIKLWVDVWLLRGTFRRHVGSRLGVQLYGIEEARGD